MFIKLCTIAICVLFTCNTFGADPKDEYIIVEDPTALIIKLPAKQKPIQGTNINVSGVISGTGDSSNRHVAPRTRVAQAKTSSNAISGSTPGLGEAALATNNPGNYRDHDGEACDALAPPGVTLDPMGGGNDLWDTGRGVVFTVDNTMTLDYVGVTKDLVPGTQVYYEVLEVANTSGDLSGGTLVADTLLSSTETGLASHTAPIGPVTLNAGSNYLVRAYWSESAVQNYYFLYDPVEFGSPPFSVGDVTVIDGTADLWTTNWVMPEFSLGNCGGGVDLCPGDLNGDGTVELVIFLHLLVHGVHVPTVMPILTMTVVLMLQTFFN